MSAAFVSSKQSDPLLSESFTQFSMDMDTSPFLIPVVWDDKIYLVPGEPNQSILQRWSIEDQSNGNERGCQSITGSPAPSGNKFQEEGSGCVHPELIERVT